MNTSTDAALVKLDVIEQRLHQHATQLGLPGPDGIVLQLCWQLRTILESPSTAHLPTVEPS